MLFRSQRAFTGEPEGENLDVKEITFREVATVVPLLALSLFLGFYPKPLFDRTEVAVKDLTEHVRIHGCYDADGEANKSRVKLEATNEGEPAAEQGAASKSAAATEPTTEQDAECTKGKK